MDRLISDLPETVDELQALLRGQAQHYEAQLAQRDQRLAQREGTIERLREQINILLAKRYGASAEAVSDAQLGLFNEAEQLAEGEPHEDDERPSTEVAGHTRLRYSRILTRRLRLSI